jgi:hypothetical protein
VTRTQFDLPKFAQHVSTQESAIAARIGSHSPEESLKPDCASALQRNNPTFVYGAKQRTRADQQRKQKILSLAEAVCRNRSAAPTKSGSPRRVLAWFHALMSHQDRVARRNADAHDFLLTPQGTALITIYDVVTADLSSVGGSKNTQVWEGSIQEIDVATGKVIFEWHSLGKVGSDESYWPLPEAPGTAWDYIHINSIAIDDDGNLLLSARHTSTVYKLDRHTGEVIWRLGGKRSDFRFGTDSRFSFQHNAVAGGPIRYAYLTTKLIPSRSCRGRASSG